MIIKNFAEAEKFLYSYIPKTDMQKFSGDWGLERCKFLMKQLGNPQEKVWVVHVAGTSGKGSTAYLVSLILHGLGFKTGLHVKPHLLDIRERFQINNRLIPEKKFVEYLNDFIPAIEVAEQSEHGRPTYFETNALLAYYVFWREGVDFAVVETGFGGLYDGTNVVKRRDKICVITRIGMDHMQILGESLEEIAAQKAGIVQRGNTVVVLKQGDEVNKVIEARAKQKWAKLCWVEEGKDFKRVKVERGDLDYRGYTRFDFQFKEKEMQNVELGLLGKHQAENASLALAAVAVLGERNMSSLGQPHDGQREKRGERCMNKKFSLGQPRGGQSEKRAEQTKQASAEKKIRNVLSQALFPGRLEIFKIGERAVVVDGAHNPQKMRAFTESLREIFPRAKFDFVVGFKKGKKGIDMLKYIVKLAETIIITSFILEGQDFSVISQEPEKLAKALKRLQFANYTVIKDTVKAVKTGLKDSQKKILVITGSLYLISKIYPELKKAL